MYSSVDANRERFFGKPFLADEIFCGLRGKTLRSFSNIKHRIFFEGGLTICGIGELPESIYIFQKGKARLFIEPDDGPRCYLRDVLPGEVLGLPELLSDFSYEAGVESFTACVCDYVSRRDLLALFESDPQLCFQVLGVLGSHLHGSYKTFSSLEFRGLHA